jgi:hypothetical protein
VIIVDLAAIFLYFCSAKNEINGFMNRILHFFAAILIAYIPVSMVCSKTIRVGVMLPLHTENGDGRRMLEYYRGILMACDSLKTSGLSIDIHAWNTPEDCEMKEVLRDPAAATCDLIIGPLYSRQIRNLSDFIAQHDIKLLIPFSITAPPLYTNRNIYQVYQNVNDFAGHTISAFLEQFNGCHPVIIDCNDTTSRKGVFTFSLRRKLEERGIDYKITNLKSSEEAFRNAFSTTKQNVVVLNTGRNTELGVALAKLNGLRNNHPELSITLFGYTEWLGYTRLYLEQFYRYNTFIPTPFYTNLSAQETQFLQQKYRQLFHQDMQQMLPRMALTGFDHTMFFLTGLQKYGKDFNGEKGQSAVKAVQTPLTFERIGNGGLRNRTLLMVNYQPEQRISVISK